MYSSSSGADPLSAWSQNPNSSRTSAHFFLSRVLSNLLTESNQSLNQVWLLDEESELLFVSLQAGS